MAIKNLQRFNTTSLVETTVKWIEKQKERKKNFFLYFNTEKKEIREKECSDNGVWFIFRVNSYAEFVNSFEDYRHTHRERKKHIHSKRARKKNEIRMREIKTKKNWFNFSFRYFFSFLPTIFSFLCKCPDGPFRNVYSFGMRRKI